MRKLRMASSLIAVSLAAATMLTACSQSGSGEGTTATTPAPSNNTTTTAAPATDGGNSNAETTSAEENSTPAGALEYASGTVLRMATGYNSKDTGLSFDAEIAGEGITLADGKTYHTGELKPTWVEVQNRLNIVIEDKYQGNNSTKEFEYWQAQMDQVDMVSGTASLLTENGSAGALVNLADYLDSMPNFKAYLEQNPIVRLSITGSKIGRAHV